jgi:DNA-binding NtrC family response regulator
MDEKILVITTSDSTIETFNRDFAEHYKISFAVSDTNAIGQYAKDIFDYIFIDLDYIKNYQTTHLTKDRFYQIFIPLQKSFPFSKKIIIAKREDTQDCILAIKLGVDSYVSYPLVKEEVQYVIDAIFEKVKSDAVLDYLEENTFSYDPDYLLESRSPEMQEVVERVRSVAKTSTTVLITGESGTGKTILARIIHHLSNRKDQKFISVHCGALPESLVESELFGHEKGSFTGAVKRKLGKFELADGGTIFLDEIGTLSDTTQIKLLQVLQERFIQRVGGESNISVDLRIIAATNSDLQERVLDGTFREDLYFRLNVFQIEMPPLRKRNEDIAKISNELLARFNHLYGKGIVSIDDQVLNAFKYYKWPGNIRELENLLERAYVLEKKKILTLENFPSNIFDLPESSKTFEPKYGTLNLNKARKSALEAFEKDYLKDLLTKSHGELKEAAEISGVSTRQLHKFIAKHHINRKAFKTPSLH